MKTKFFSGDKVFAKVRGYPFWPARIVNLINESASASKIRYEIIFYGTGEKSIVKAEEVQPFLEKRHEFGKPKKQKAFNDAMAEIESELSPEELSTDFNNSETVTEETVAPKSRKSGRTPKQSIGNRLENSTGSSGEVKSNRGRKRKSQNEAISQETISSPETTRTGRTIKFKRFNPNVAAKSKASPAKKKIIEKIGDYLKFVHEGVIYIIPLNVNKPSLNCPKSLLDWNRLVYEEAVELKEKIINGDISLQQAKDDLFEFTREKMYEKKKEYEENDKDFRILKVEAKLLQLDVKIKKALTLGKANPFAACKHLNDLINLPLTPLMIKKHPEIIETFKRLSRYVGNVDSWTMNDEEKALFASQAASVRDKSEAVLAKIKDLFELQEGQSFSQFFTSQLQLFSRATFDLNQDDFFSLVREPPLPTPVMPE